MHETSSGTFVIPQPRKAARGIPMGVQKHFTGSLVFGDDEGQVMGFQSHTEKQTALVMLARRDVVDLENQIPFEWTDATGKLRIHYFDFRVSLRSGKLVALMVKNSKKASEADFIAEMRCIARQAVPEISDRVSLITEKHLDPIELHNAELIHSVRLPDPESDVAVRAVVAGINGSARIRDIVAAAGVSGRGFLAVVRMIGRHELELVAHERIEPGVQVRRRIF